MGISNPLDRQRIVQIFRDSTYISPGITTRYGVFRNNILLNIRGHSSFSSRSAASNSLNRFISESINAVNINNWERPYRVIRVLDTDLQLFTPEVSVRSYNLKRTDPQLYKEIFDLFVIRPITSEDVAHLNAAPAPNE